MSVRLGKKKVQTYAWNENMPFEPKCPAEAFAQEVARIQQEKGGIEIKADDVVEAARSETSPMHADFEWNDSKAGHSWRLTQARALLRGLVTTVVVLKDTSPEPRRAIVSVRQDRHRSYVPLTEVLKSPDMMRSVLDDARRDMNAFVNRYRMYAELAEVVGVMEKTLKIWSENNTGKN